MTESVQVSFWLYAGQEASENGIASWGKDATGRLVAIRDSNGDIWPTTRADVEMLKPPYHWSVVYDLSDGKVIREVFQYKTHADQRKTELNDSGILAKIWKV